MTDSTLAKALAHPTRRRILQIVSDRVASPREIAVELDQPIGRVSHHVRWLAARDYVELVDTQPRRGALEHFYRATVRPIVSDEAWSRLSPQRRRFAVSETLSHLERLVREGRAARAGDDGNVTYTGA